MVLPQHPLDRSIRWAAVGQFAHALDELTQGGSWNHDASEPIGVHGRGAAPGAAADACTRIPGVDAEGGEPSRPSVSASSSK